MMLRWNNESFIRELEVTGGYQRFGYEQTNIHSSPATAVSQQKGASESSRIYEVKHVFRQNNDVFL